MSDIYFKILKELMVNARKEHRKSRVTLIARIFGINRIKAESECESVNVHAFTSLFSLFDFFKVNMLTPDREQVLLAGNYLAFDYPLADAVLNKLGSGMYNRPRAVL